MKKLPTEMRRLKQLEDENAKLRKVVADLSARQADRQRVHRSVHSRLRAKCLNATGSRVLQTP